MTTYAIVTGMGQSRFLTHDGNWTLAPSRHIRLFESLADANKTLQRQRKCQASPSMMIVPFTPR